MNVNPNLNIGGSVDFVWAMLDLQMAQWCQFGDMLPYGIGTQTFGTQLVAPWSISSWDLGSCY
jgi:hypothetical protein